MSGFSPEQIGRSTDDGEDMVLAPPLFQADPSEVLGLRVEAEQDIWLEQPRHYESVSSMLSSCGSTTSVEVKATPSGLTSARVEQEVAACVMGPSAAPQHRRFAGRAASKVRNFAGKAVAPLRSAASMVSNGATTLPAHLSFRVVIFFAIFFAGCVVLLDFVFPEFVRGSSRVGNTAVTSSQTEYAKTGDSESTMSSVPAIIFASLFLPTAFFLVYRRQALMQRISKLQRLLPNSRRRYKYSALGGISLEKPPEDQDCFSYDDSPSRVDSFDSEGFETCDESALSGDEEAAIVAARGHMSQLPLLDWVSPQIRDPLIASWSLDERRKVKELAAYLTSSEPSKAVGAAVTAFGHPEVCAWRFLRTSWDVETAKQRLKDTASWRAEVLSARAGISGDKAFRAAGGCELPAPATEAAKKIFVRNRHLFPAAGWDGGVYDTVPLGGHCRWWNAHDGSPVELWLLGQCDAHEICSRFTQDELVDCYMEYNERRRERVNACRAAGFLVVFDAAGMGFSHLRKGLKYAWRASAVLEMGEKHYPGSIRKVFVTSAPAFVHAGYMAVQPVLGAATRNSVTITAKPAEEVEDLVNLLPQGLLQEMRASLK